MITKDLSTVHAQRLKFYHDSSLNVTSDLLHNIALTGNTYVIEQIDDIRIDPVSGDVQLHVRWLGFQDDDATWEPFETIKDDTPDIVRQFLASRSDTLSCTLLHDF